jgi:hypothetical protein
MKSFIFGVSLPFLAEAAYIGWSVGRFGVMRPKEIGALAILLLVIPPVAAWMAAALMQLRRARRLLSRSRRGFVAPLLLGVFAGSLTLGLLGFELYYADRFLPDAVIVGVTTFLITALLIAVLPRLKPGRCRACNYDISASLDFNRCPECGSAVTM